MKQGQQKQTKPSSNLKVKICLHKVFLETTERRVMCVKFGAQIVHLHCASQGSQTLGVTDKPLNEGWVANSSLLDSWTAVPLSLQPQNVNIEFITSWPWLLAIVYSSWSSMTPVSNFQRLIHTEARLIYQRWDLSCCTVRDRHWARVGMVLALPFSVIGAHYFI